MDYLFVEICHLYSDTDDIYSIVTVHFNDGIDLSL